MREIKQEHLAGLELALDRWNDGGPAAQFAALLHDLIAQAKAAQAGTVKDSLTVDIVAYAAFAENGNIQLWGKSRAPFENLYNLVGDPQPLMTVAQHQEIVGQIQEKSLPHRHQLVPINQTDKMLLAGYDAIVNRYLNTDDVYWAYIAMLEAAPQPFKESTK